MPSIDSNRATFRLRFGIIAAVLALAAAGCSHQQALPTAGLPIGDESPLGASSSNDAWPTFAYDYKRTGYNPNVTKLTKKNVAKLALLWKENVGDSIFASPVEYAGNLIVVTQGARNDQPGSVVYDFSTTDGHVIWKFGLQRKAKMPPTIDPATGLVFVGRQGPSSYLFALRLLDGSVVWHQPVRGLLTSAPVVAGGWVYAGRSGGDPPACTQGGITAFNEQTGAIGWVWNVDPNRKKGGSVWGAIAYDGTHLTFGTGNTCEQPVPTANGAVQLDLNGQPIWNTVAVKDSHYDSDSGGGVMLFHGDAHFINKNGMFYALNDHTGNVAWETELNSEAHNGNWSGGFATPTTDGTTILVGSGLYKGTTTGGDAEFCMLNGVRPDEYFQGYHSKLQGMNLNGHVLWTVSMRNRLVGYVAIAQGIGYVGLNQEFVALDVSTGKKLWTYATPDYINASMVVVPSGLYGADQAGNVYAFGLKK